MIDFSEETLLSIEAACKEFPNCPHRSTVWRYAMKGINGVRLETVVCGGRRFTSRQAILRFIAGTTAAANGEPMPLPPSAQRRREKASARNTLLEAGIAGSKPRSEPMNQVDRKGR